MVAYHPGPHFQIGIRGIGILEIFPSIFEIFPFRYLGELGFWKCCSPHSQHPLYACHCTISWGGKCHLSSLNSHRNFYNYLWQLLILYSIQFVYPIYSRNSFSDEIMIMIRHYEIHPHLKIRHYVIYPTISNSKSIHLDFACFF